MGLFKSIGKGLKNATKFVGKKVVKPVGKGVGNAAKWSWDHKLAAAGIGVGAATILSGGEFLVQAGSKIKGVVSKLGKTKMGKMFGKAVDSGVVLNKKISSTLKKNGLPNDSGTTNALAEYIREKAAGQGVDLLKSTTIDANYKVRNRLADTVGNVIGQGVSLFGKSLVTETGVNTGNPLQNAANSLFGKFGFGNQMQQQNQNNSNLLATVAGMFNSRAASEAKQAQGESTIEKLMMLKMMDKESQIQAPEKESFFEKLIMMKSLISPQPSNIQAETPAQTAALNSLQNELQMNKFQQLMESAKSSPQKMVTYTGGALLAIAAIAFMFNKKK